MPADATVGEALAQRAGERARAEQQVSVVCVVDDDGHAGRGACRWPSWSAPSPSERGPQRSTETPDCRPSRPRPTLPEVARLMTDYNLIAMPVVDGDGKPVGVIAVDDVLELLAARGVAPAGRRGARLAKSFRGPVVPSKQPQIRG